MPCISSSADGRGKLLSETAHDQAAATFAKTNFIQYVCTLLYSRTEPFDPVFLLMSDVCEVSVLLSTVQ